MHSPTGKVIHVENMKIYTEVLIHKHHSGFGMWQAGELQSSPTNSFAYISDLMATIDCESKFVLPLEDALVDPDFIAVGIEDISGKLYNQPNHIFARIDRWNNFSYFGVEESEVPEDYFGDI